MKVIAPLFKYILADVTKIIVGCCDTVLKNGLEITSER